MFNRLGGKRFARVFMACLTMSLSVLGWATTTSQAQQDIVVTKSYRGLNSLRVETNNQYGARRTLSFSEITIKDAKGPSPSDRDLLIVFYNNPYGTAIEGFSYTVPATLPEGQNSVTVEIPYFDGGQQSAWDVGVFENGRDIEDRRATSKLTGNGQTFQWSYQSNTIHNTFIAVQGSKETLNHVRNDVLKLYGIPANASNNITIRGIPSSSSQLAVAELHDDWRCYMLGTSWVMSLETLQEIQQRAPNKAAALRQYVGSGGRLIVHSATSQSLEDFVESTFLGLKDSSAAVWTYAQFSSNQNTSGNSFTSWKPVLGEVKEPSQLTSLSDQSLEELISSQQRQNSDLIRIVRRDYLGGELIAVLLDPNNFAMPSFSTSFSTTTLGQTTVTLPDGSIVVTDNDLQSLVDAVENAEADSGESKSKSESESEAGGKDSDTGPNEKSADTQDENPAENRSSNKQSEDDETDAVEPSEVLFRFQMSAISQLNQQTTDPAAVASDGNWFWKNLIASVGKPPVWVFAGLVAVFGALLGPGLLFLTGRIGRRSLMIFMVPVISLIATFAIVSYGVLHEGFENNGRITSITYASQDAPETFMWSRQTYFSGLPPREGLRFRKNTYARPVYPDFDNNYSGSVDPRDAVSGRILLKEDEQQWLGWIRARQQQQLLVGHPGDKLAPLIEVTYTDAPPTDPRELNQEESELLAEALEAMTPQERMVASLPNVRVTNVSGQNLPFVVIHGTANQYYFCDEISAGDEVVVQPLSGREAGARVGIKMVDIRPATPPEMEDGGTVFDFGRVSTSSRYNESEDVLNLALKNYFGSKLQMKPFSFATILAENPLLEIPLESQIDDSLHLVIGEHYWEDSDVGN